MVPEKLYVEVSTRCNLSCEKCVKQVSGNKIGDALLPFDLFTKLAPDLAGVQHLILNGIGEPLLHSQLTSIVSFASKKMAPGTRIGFQTNGLLLTIEKARELISAGATTICLSLDSMITRHPLNTASGTSFESVEQALSIIDVTSRELGKKVETGLEIVIDQNNIHELVDMVEWAVEKKVDFVLVTHLFPYDQEMESQSLFSPNSKQAIALFEKYRDMGGALGLDVQQGVAAQLKYQKNAEEKAAIGLLQQLYGEAAESNIPLNIENLLGHDSALFERVQTIFNQVELIATSSGLALTLPPLYADYEAPCSFIDESAAFISCDGEVTPCHFLWHSYPCLSGNDIIDVEQKSFGSLEHCSLSEIWQSDEFQRFREGARMGNFSPCWSCTQGPCQDLVETNLLDAHDCYGSNVPCGHCRWGLGGVICL